MSEAMFTLCGQVANVYVQPGGVSKKTGEAFDPRDKVQILGNIPLPEGGKRLDLVTLSVEDARPYQAAVGKQIRVPVGCFASGRNVAFFIPRGARLALVTGSQAS